MGNTDFASLLLSDWIELDFKAKGAYRRQTLRAWKEGSVLLNRRYAVYLDPIKRQRIIMS